MMDEKIYLEGPVGLQVPRFPCAHYIGMHISVSKSYLDNFRAQVPWGCQHTDLILEVDGIQRTFTYDELLVLVKTDKPNGAIS